MEHASIDPGVRRLLDAASNRTREGLRVLEDLARFVWDDPALVEAAKSLRHDVTTAVQRLEAQTGPLIHARDTVADVGTSLTTQAETARDDASALVRANAARAEEGLRSLEEAVKLLDRELAGEFKALRYRAYTLEAAALQRAEGHHDA